MPSPLKTLFLSALLVLSPLVLVANSSAAAEPSAPPAGDSAPAVKAIAKPVVKTVTSKTIISKTVISKTGAAKKQNSKTVVNKSKTTTKVAAITSTKSSKRSAIQKTTTKSVALAKTNAKTSTKTLTKTKAVAVAGAAIPEPINSADLDAYHDVAKAYLVKIGDQVIWEGSAEKRLPPASLTKMMTALLVVESYRPDDIVTVSAEAEAETGSRIGLRAGDRMLLADVLAATLIRSANDACHALADWHSGSEAVFVERMNQRAQQLGLHDTHFENACGHDNPDHYSSAHDLAVIAETAQKNPTFARIVTKPRLAVRSADGRRTFRFKSTNHLIGVLDGVMGTKTGFTEGAGPCLVATAERNNVRVTLVLLNARNRWWSATAMIDNAFAQVPHLAAKKHTIQQAANSEAPASATPTGAPLASGV